MDTLRLRGVLTVSSCCRNITASSMSDDINVLSCCSGGQKCKLLGHWAKIKVSAGWSLPAGLREKRVLFLSGAGLWPRESA